MIEELGFIVLCLLCILMAIIFSTILLSGSLFILLTYILYDFEFDTPLEEHVTSKFKNVYLPVINFYESETCQLVKFVALCLLCIRTAVHFSSIFLTSSLFMLITFIFVDYEFDTALERHAILAFLKCGRELSELHKFIVLYIICIIIAVYFKRILVTSMLFILLTYVLCDFEFEMKLEQHLINKLKRICLYIMQVFQDIYDTYRPRRIIHSYVPCTVEEQPVVDTSILKPVKSLNLQQYKQAIVEVNTPGLVGKIVHYHKEAEKRESQRKAWKPKKILFPGKALILSPRKTWSSQTILRAWRTPSSSRSTSPWTDLKPWTKPIPRTAQNTRKSRTRTVSKHTAVWGLHTSARPRSASCPKLVSKSKSALSTETVSSPKRSPRLASRFGTETKIWTGMGPGYCAPRTEDSSWIISTPNRILGPRTVSTHGFEFHIRTRSFTFLSPRPVTNFRPLLRSGPHGQRTFIQNPGRCTVCVARPDEPWDKQMLEEETEEK